VLTAILAYAENLSSLYFHGPLCGPFTHTTMWEPLTSVNSSPDREFAGGLHWLCDALKLSHTYNSKLSSCRLAPKRLLKFIKTLVTIYLYMRFMLSLFNEFDFHTCIGESEIGKRSTKY